CAQRTLRAFVLEVLAVLYVLLRSPQAILISMPPTLAELGWNDFFAAGFAPHGEQGMLPGRVMRELRGAYELAMGTAERPEMTASPAGRLWYGEHGEEGGGAPAVGDWVAVRPPGSPGEPGLI